MPTISRAKRNNRKRTTQKSTALAAAASSVLNKEQQLKEYAEEIRGLVKLSLQSAVRIGQILADVRDNILEYGEWQDWIDQEFPGDIKHDTAINFINVAKLYEEFSETHADGLEKLGLSSLYHLGRGTLDTDFRKKVLELAAEDEPFTQHEVITLARTYRKVKMSEAGITQPSLLETLQDVPAIDNPKELAAFQKLSSRKQQAVAELFSTGQADSTKSAIKILKETKQLQEEEQQLQTVEVDYTTTQTVNYRSLEEVPSNSVALAVVEAPLRTSYVEQGLTVLCTELDRILETGGYAIITVGHKAAMFAGDKLAGLKPLHLLCLRRQPGSSRTIIGTNIISASVFAIFAYKDTYRAPKTMLVDLHTFGEETLAERPEEVTGLDEVETGLEKGFERILSSLTQRGDNVLHVIASSQHFNIRAALYAACETIGVKEFRTC